MCRIIAVTLLFIILVDNFYDTTASHGFHVSKVHIRNCRCRVFTNGKLMCPYPLLPTNPVKKLDLVKCLCSKGNQQKFPEFQTICRSWRPDFIISLV